MWRDESIVRHFVVHFFLRFFAISQWNCFPFLKNLMRLTSIQLTQTRKFFKNVHFWVIIKSMLKNVETVSKKIFYWMWFEDEMKKYWKMLNLIGCQKDFKKNIEKYYFWWDEYLKIRWKTLYQMWCNDDLNKVLENVTSDGMWWRIQWMLKNVEKHCIWVWGRVEKMLKKIEKCCIWGDVMKKW